MGGGVGGGGNVGMLSDKCVIFLFLKNTSQLFTWCIP